MKWDIFGGTKVSTSEKEPIKLSLMAMGVPL